MWLNKSSPFDDIKLTWDIEEDISTSSGAITIDWNFIGERIKSNFGNIKVNGFNAGQIKNSSGNISVTLHSNGDIKTSQGKISIGWSSQWKLETSSGDVSVWKKSDWDIKTSQGKVSIKWDSTGRIKTSSGDIFVWNDSEWGIKTNQGKISVEWNSVWKVETSSGDITIIWDSTWDVKSSQWKIIIGGQSHWDIKTSSWDVKIWYNSIWNIKTSQWKVSIHWNSVWSIRTTSWDIEVGINYGTMETVSWSITALNTKIIIEKIQMNVQSVSGETNWKIWGILWRLLWRKNTDSSNISISIWGRSQSTSIINWVTYINGKRVSTNSQDNSYTVTIEGLKIDFLEKKFYLNESEVDLKKLNETSGGNTIEIIWDTIVVVYKWQKITISEDNVRVIAI